MALARIDSMLEKGYRVGPMLGVKSALHGACSPVIVSLAMSACAAASSGPDEVRHGSTAGAATGGGTASGGQLNVSNGGSTLDSGGAGDGSAAAGSVTVPATPPRGQSPRAGRAL
jgi:hypothetical protein